MCKHLLNAQVAIRYYDGNWYDCPKCFEELNKRYPDLSRQGTVVVMACKLCRKCFRKDLTQFEEADEYCPHCNNHYVVEAVTPETLAEKKKLDREKRLRAQREALIKKAEEANAANDVKNDSEVMEEKEVEIEDNGDGPIET